MKRRNKAEAAPPEPMPDRIEYFASRDLAEHFVAAFGGEIEEREGFPLQVRLKFGGEAERDDYLAKSTDWMKSAAEDLDFLAKLENPLLTLSKDGDVKRLEGPDLGIPPCPPEDPQAGDKTPAVIRWWFKHHPEEAKAKYDHRNWDRTILSDV